MSVKRFQLCAQIVGYVTIGLLALLGLLNLVSGGVLVSAAPGEAPNAPQAGAPAVMNYQGTLEDAAGDPLNGTYTMTFRIYESPLPTVTTALWSEEHVNVTVQNGYFNVLLGYNAPLSATLFSHPDRYIGVTVDPYAEMTPRQRFASVPYAFHADHTEYAYGLSASDGDPVDAVSVDDAGNVTVGAGNLTVGVGDVQVTGGGLCIDSDGACTSPSDGELRVSGGGIHGGNSSSQNLYLVPDSGDVGIGTTSPAEKLDIAGNVIMRNVTPTLSFNHDGGNREWAIRAYGEDFQIYEDDETGDPVELAITGDNKVGIGTDSPTAKLDVNGSINTSGNITWSGHLGSMGVSSEYTVFADQDSNPLPQTEWMWSSANSICFLTGQENYHLSSDSDYSACWIEDVSGTWRLNAQVNDSGDNAVECSARCLRW